ncbi:MAG: TRAM domain-containing protein, partial [Firmicutes bacterium]|nr:TRAM domain-containing protein [Bacillota bacterium]
MADRLLDKNQILHLTCERLGAELEGVCRYQGFTVFVPGALPGETIDARVLKVQPSYAFAKIETLQCAAAERTEPFCPVYD